VENNGISRETLVALHETEGIGWKTISELWEARHSRPIYEGMREADLRNCGLSPKQAAMIAASLAPDRIEQRRARRVRSQINIVTLADSEYPRMLKNTIDPPPVLYYKGRLDLISRPSIGIVGTRLATAYGRHVAEEYSSVFADYGFTVVSGMAKGIDTCAHRGALHRKGGTIAVLGTPVDQIYPPENRQLYGHIAEQGLVLSEAPPDSPYHPGMFPVRNRIIAGLSLCVIIVEAPYNSGSLITARKAAEADRTVYVVPGPVTSPRSSGGLQLLKEGLADIIVDPADVLKVFQSSIEVDVRRRDLSPVIDTLTPDESRIHELLMDHDRSVDELLDDTGMSFGLLHTVLLSLQVKKKIKQFPGSLYGIL
jgi:DNA processing protein